MRYLASIALMLMVAVTFGSASWAGGKSKLTAMPSGRPATATRNIVEGGAEESVDKNSNQVLLTNPNKVCENPISAAGEKSHCADPALNP